MLFSQRIMVAIHYFAMKQPLTTLGMAMHCLLLYCMLHMHHAAVEEDDASDMSSDPELVPSEELSGMDDDGDDF